MQIRTASRYHYACQLAPKKIDNDQKYKEATKKEKKLQIALINPYYNYLTL